MNHVDRRKTKSSVTRPWPVCGVLTLALLITSGCVQSPALSSVSAPYHPANPGVITGPAVQKDPVFDFKPGQAVHEEASRTDDASAAVVYVCPMHAQIRMAEPGQCPICHMTLKPEHVSAGESQHEGH